MGIGVVLQYYLLMEVSANEQIGRIVDHNLGYAYVLFSYGISFYHHHHDTLSQVCYRYGLPVEQVLRSLNKAETSNDNPEPALINYPVELIVEYLKHTHHVFIKQRIPYISNLITNLSVRDTPVAKDLQFVMPLLREDLITHMYEEEDQLFSYILILGKAIKQGNPYLSEAMLAMQNLSIQQFAVEHQHDDDDMQKIRTITENYQQDSSTSLHVKVVYEELKRFEQELMNHARLENEVLFPKALILERKIKSILANQSISN